MTKQEIINDEIFFQRACDLWVERNIGQCVSSLMYDVGRNLEECSRIFDFDYDEALGWFQREDYEEVVSYHISNLDRDEVVEYLTGRSIECRCDEDIATLREAMFEDIKSEDLDEYARENGIDPDYDEVYEHYIVNSSWAADDLRAYGQIVFEFGGMTIFGRCTTGQSVLLDGWVCRLMRDLPDDHWIWSAVK
jgi:hypothetical protein